MCYKFTHLRFQVCTLSVYLFMVASLFGRQYLDPAKNYPKHDMDLYFPYFTLFQLTFYLGWLKVRELPQNYYYIVIVNGVYYKI